MNENNENNTQSSQPQEAEAVTPFSMQPTGLVETTFAETLGLSMHNAITNQQSSQMTTSASVTNACARLLQTPIPVKAKKEKSPDDASGDGAEGGDGEMKKEKPKSEFKITNFLKRNKQEEQGDE